MSPAGRRPAGRARCAARTSTSPTPFVVAVPERDRRRPPPRAAARRSRSRRCEAVDDANPFVAFRPLPRVGGVRRGARHDRAARAAMIASSTRRSRRRRRRLHVTPFARADALSDALGLHRRRRRVGEGRDRQRRRQPQGPPPRARSCCTCWPPSARARAVARRCRSAAAGHRLVRQRRDRRGDAGAGGRLAARVFVPPHADPAWSPCLDELRRGDRRVPAARRRPAGRSVHAPLPRGGRRRRDPVHACRARRTRCASTAAARSAGRWRGSSSDGVGPPLDRVFVQVGGGALAACAGAGRPDERRDAEVCTPCRPRAARRCSGRGTRPPTRRRRRRRRRTGASACGRGSTSARRPPTASSTTRRTTGSR